jgi:hypothetical protein
VTGVNFFAGEVVAKRLLLLHEMVPKAVRIAVIVDPTNAKSGTRARHQLAAGGAVDRRRGNRIGLAFCSIA